MVRIWLYLSPILWYIEDVPHSLAPLIRFNPLVYLIGGWSDLLVRSQVPPVYIWVGAAAWGIAAAVVGSLFFMSREREFAVRL
jgi:teichoic acid transport system permease protein